MPHVPRDLHPARHPYPFTVQYETREEAAAAVAQLVKDDAVTMVRFEEAAPRVERRPPRTNLGGPQQDRAVHAGVRGFPGQGHSGSSVST